MGRAMVVHRCECGEQYLVFFGGGEVADDQVTWAETAAEVGRSLHVTTVDGDQFGIACSCGARYPAAVPLRARASGTEG